MVELRTSSSRVDIIPRLTSSWLVIAATTMFSLLPINFDGHLKGLSFSSAEAAVQCAPQPLSCARARCVRVGPGYAGLFYQARGCLRWSCSGKRR